MLACSINFASPEPSGAISQTAALASPVSGSIVLLVTASRDPSAENDPAA